MAFNSTYPSKNAFLKTVAELIRGHPENQKAFVAFTTHQGIDAVVACLRLAFDSHQVGTAMEECQTTLC